MSESRYNRNEQFFGAAGQARLRTTTVGVVGVGGLGSHVVQQIGYLGVRSVVLIDPDIVTLSSLNRLVGAVPSDVGRPKVDVVRRLLISIDPAVSVVAIPAKLSDATAVHALIAADVVVGCLDSEGSRLQLNEICSAADKPYVDLATDILPAENLFGGRVFVNWSGDGCLVCMNLLDLREVQQELQSDQARRDRRDLYGVGREALHGGGPSVVSINGVVASLGVTELMLGVVGVRTPRRLLTYRGHLGTVAVSLDPPESDCFYCCGLRGRLNQSPLLTQPGR